jgi:hypothetical protein
MLFLIAEALLIVWLLLFIPAYSLGGFTPFILVLSVLFFAGGFFEKKWKRKEYV